MITYQEFQDIPPRMFLEQIMEGVCKAYCFLWDRKDKNNKVRFSWKDLSKYYNKNSFKTNLRKLNEKGLLDYKETENGITIELVGWDTISDNE